MLSIGDRCVIGRGSHIVAHHSIEIGDDVFTGPYVYITDQNHGYADPDIPIGRQVPTNTAVSISAGAWLRAGAIVLPGARIGRNVVVGAARSFSISRCRKSPSALKISPERSPDSAFSTSMERW